MNESFQQLISIALAEDLNNIGDVTSIATIDCEQLGSANIIAKGAGVMAGGFMVDQVCKAVDPALNVMIRIPEGNRIQSGQEVVTISGSLRSILTAERTALNFLMRLSGIATLTARFCELVKDTNTKILDTRKTTPGLRWLEKYAVRVGGGTNHRSGLYDMILIKENHIAAAGSIEKAVSRCREYLKRNKLHLKIEVETTNLTEVEQALNLKVDRIMLDNMNLQQIKQAVQLVAHSTELEISGGVNLLNIADFAQAGVDYISIGALTHSANALDFSLLVKETYH